MFRKINMRKISRFHINPSLLGLNGLSKFNRIQSRIGPPVRYFQSDTARIGFSARCAFVLGVFATGATTFVMANSSLVKCEQERAPEEGRKRVLLKREMTRGTKLLEKNSEYNRMTSLSAPSSNQESQRSHVRQNHYEYIIVGTGTAAQAACEMLKQSDPTASLLIVTDYTQLPRPDVSSEEIEIGKELQGVFNRWRRQLSSHLHAMVTEEDEAELQGSKRTDVIVTKGFQGVRIDMEAKVMSLGSQGTIVSYNKCLLAPPGKIRSHYVLDAGIQYSLREFVNPLKTLQDFKVLQAYFNNPPEGSGERNRKVVVVGGGFLGTEMASTLAQLNNRLDPESRMKIYHVYFEQNPLDTYVPKYLAKHLKKLLLNAGVVPLPNRLVSDVQLSKGNLNSNGTTTERTIEAKFVTLTNEHEALEFQYMVMASTRVDPDVDIAKRSRIEIDPSNGGVLVNESLEAFRDLFVAGTAASFHNQALGRRRVSVYDHSINSGLTAARNMLASGRDEGSSSNTASLGPNGRVESSEKEQEGAGNMVQRVDTRLSTYKHQPAFLSLLNGLDTKLECVGEIDSRLRTVGVWLAKRDESTGQPCDSTDYRRGLVYYLRNSKVVGVLCCNASECLDAARNLINEGELVDGGVPSQLKKKIRLGPDFWTRVYES